MSAYRHVLDARRSRAWLAAGLVMLGGLVANAAQAQPVPGAPPPVGRPTMHGPGMHHGAGLERGPDMFMGRGLARMLAAVNASEAQKAEIQKIAEAARRDIVAQHQAGRALREQALQLFGQPTLDAGAIEAVRQKMTAQHDRVSQRMTQAMLDIGKVLTPEQRSQLVERIGKRTAMAERHARERRELHGQPAR